MDYRKEARAKLLNEAEDLLFRAHHNLGWNSYYTPNHKDLKKVKECLERALTCVTSVLDDKLFQNTPSILRVISPTPDVE